MMMDNSEKSILITGCSSGIGLCVAKGLHGRGYRIFATARKPEDVEKLKAEGLASLRLDLDDSESINQAVNEILKQTDGKIYALFNNGAYQQPGAIEDLSRETLHKQFETNLFGWLELTNLLIPVMRKQGYGRIIQNSSILGFMAFPFRGAYVATKYALEGLTDTLRLELKDSGIFVSLVEPGPITSKIRKNGYLAYKKNINKETSFHRETYEALEARMQKEGAVVPFTLPPEAVLKKVIHALESPRPKIRYYVTFPTYLFGYLRRILSSKIMDKLLIRI